MIDITRCPIVIVGGGAVAGRKAMGLVDAGASQLRVISPQFLANFPALVEKVHRPYQPGDLKQARLVFAATNSATINDSVVREAQAIGAWVNRADGSDDNPGDFVTPAKFVSGAVTVMVSAGSAALAALIRDQIQQRFDPAWSEMADAMKTLRPLIKNRRLDASARAELFRRLATADAMQVLRTQGLAGLQHWIGLQD